MKKISTTILLTPEQYQLLETLSKETNLSKSKIIEEALKRYFEMLDVKIAEMRALTSTSDDFVPHKKVKEMVK